MMISFNRHGQPRDRLARLQAAERAALDDLRAELDPETSEEAVDQDWPDDEPLPVSAFRPPVLSPDVLQLPASMVERAEMHLAEIGLCDRTLNALEDAGLHLVGELLARTPNQILALPRCGPSILEEVYTALARIGFYRRPRNIHTH